MGPNDNIQGIPALRMTIEPGRQLCVFAYLRKGQIIQCNDGFEVELLGFWSDQPFMFGQKIKATLDLKQWNWKLYPDPVICMITKVEKDKKIILLPGTKVN